MALKNPIGIIGLPDERWRYVAEHDIAMGYIPEWMILFDNASQEFRNVMNARMSIHTGRPLHQKVILSKVSR